ncbi:hypothetical protein Q8A67_014133 [Cirrhinus molitorella]|uniref:Uncharacterized protein n=1 Tax=Cirrhinus molitorella TaxID=172907 RepID=A0AA88PJT5_9TELE|nr:hypothetical protein Q8A67_014133 [Cirrhinus molitorella]
MREVCCEGVQYRYQSDSLPSADGLKRSIQLINHPLSCPQSNQHPNTISPETSEASKHLIDQGAYGMFALIGKVLALIKGLLLLPRPVFGPLQSSELWTLSIYPAVPACPLQRVESCAAARSPAPALKLPEVRLVTTESFSSSASDHRHQRFCQERPRWVFPNEYSLENENAPPTVLNCERQQSDASSRSPWAGPGRGQMSPYWTDALD